MCLAKRMSVTARTTMPVGQSCTHSVGQRPGVCRQRDSTLAGSRLGWYALHQQGRSLRKRTRQLPERPSPNVKDVPRAPLLEYRQKLRLRTVTPAFHSHHPQRPQWVAQDWASRWICGRPFSPTPIPHRPQHTPSHPTASHSPYSSSTSPPQPPRTSPSPVPSQT